MIVQANDFRDEYLSVKHAAGSAKAVFFDAVVEGGSNLPQVLLSFDQFVPSIARLKPAVVHFALKTFHAAGAAYTEIVDHLAEIDSDSLVCEIQNLEEITDFVELWSGRDGKYMGFEASFIIGGVKYFAAEVADWVLDFQTTCEETVLYAVAAYDAFRPDCNHQYSQQSIKDAIENSAKLCLSNGLFATERSTSQMDLFIRSLVGPGIPNTHLRSVINRARAMYLSQPARSSAKPRL